MGSTDNAPALDRTGYVCDFREDFAEPVVNPTRWVDQYLPHWTTPERAAARYDVSDGVLRLRVDADQPAWREADGELRASNIQSGTFNGPVGSDRGQHRYRSGLEVVNPRPAARLYLPSAATGSRLVEVDLKASADPTVMLAFWLIGFEEDPRQSGELCVCELFGSDVGPGGSSLNVGVKAHHDPSKREDVEKVLLPKDFTQWHTYSVEWTSEVSRFYVDDEHVRTVEQGFDYPMQLMIDLFEFPSSPSRDAEDYPKVGWVRNVRGYRREASASG